MSFTPMNVPPAGFAAVPAPNGAAAPPPAPAPSDQDRAQALQAVAHAFDHDPALSQDLHLFLSSPDATPQALKLLARVSTYVKSREHAAAEQARRVAELEQQVGSGQAGAAPAPAPAKKTPAIRVAEPQAAAQAPPAAEVDYSGARFEGVSFSIPQRKKLTLEIAASSKGGVRALNAQGSPEFALPYSQIEHVFRLQVPEKMQALDHFLALPARSAAAAEQIVWTSNDYLPRGAAEDDVTQSAQHVAALHAAGLAAVEADAEHFTAAAPNPRKGASHHTRAFKGSKEGFLFFLRTGVLFGFKKPVLHFALRDIRSLACTTVTKHTFSLVLEAPDPIETDGEPKTWEFSLIDQVDFPGIRGYVERHDLHESSMDQRRAKEITEPKKRRRDEGEDGDEYAKGGELEKATKAARGEEDWGGDSEDDPEDDDFAASDSDGGSPGESDDDDDDDDDDGPPGGGDDDEDDEMEEDE